MFGLLGLLKSLLELFGLIGREVHEAEQRQAGADAIQNEATNAEIQRVQDAANAGAAIDGVRDKPDPLDRDGQ